MGSIFSTPKAPPAPDPVATANAQGAANAETARLQQKMNMVDQYNPYGATTFSPIGDDRYRVDTHLSPLGQSAFDSQARIDAATNSLAEGQLGRIGQAVSGPLDFSKLPSLTQDFSADRDAVTNALMERNKPQMDLDQRRVDTQLTNQGIPRGSEAWKTSQDDIARRQNDFRLAAINAGGQEQSRLYGLTADARNRMINEMLQQRSQPINEMAALLGTGQVTMPNAPNIPQTNVNGTDVLGANSLAYQGAMSNYNQKMGARNSLMGGLSGLGGAGLLAMSDIRLKEDITPVGIEKGLPVYTFRYRSDPERRLYRGVMAQDVLETMPEAVGTIGEYMAVDYGMLGIKFEEVH